MTLGDVPLQDPVALEQWILANRGRVTPIVLERLLEHNWYEDVGEAPTQGRARCAVWKPKYVDRYPELDDFQIWVYYTDLITRANLDAAFRALARFRQWQQYHGTVFSMSEHPSRSS